MNSIQCFLLDIEGTTTSISFVKDVLFPYVRENLQNFLEDNWDQTLVQEDIGLLREQAKEDVRNGLDVPDIAPEASEKSQLINSVIANVYWQMDRDRKISALKQLQGHMWRESYEKGAIKGHIYEDVLDAFHLWTSKGKNVYIYSSGSVEAQRLLFGHSEKGDLLPYLSGHFDTKIGLKNQKTSYLAIAQSIGFSTSDILFLTDIPAEALAATEAGMQARLMIRPGNGELTADHISQFPPFHTFKEVSQWVFGDQ